MSDPLEHPAARRLRLLAELARLRPDPAELRAAIARALPGLTAEQVEQDLADAAAWYLAEAKRLEERAAGGGTDQELE